MLIKSSKNVTAVILFGSAIALMGYIIGHNWVQYFQWFIPLGTFIVFLGIYYFFKTVDLAKEFEFKDDDDFLAYFWNVLVLKIWTFIIFIWMILGSLKLIRNGEI